mmetsp:Transcript_15860/g.44449  ORF Transcript_15860/g.44449 Transcript_15860/m.44449 type:complete len:255 (-) Transcript_15860:2103-2867(-)
MPITARRIPGTPAPVTVPAPAPVAEAIFVATATTVAVGSTSTTSSLRFSSSASSKASLKADSRINGLFFRLDLRPFAFFCKHRRKKIRPIGVRVLPRALPSSALSLLFFGEDCRRRGDDGGGGGDLSVSNNFSRSPVLEECRRADVVNPDDSCCVARVGVLSLAAAPAGCLSLIGSGSNSASEMSDSMQSNSSISPATSSSSTIMRILNVFFSSFGVLGGRPRPFFDNGAQRVAFRDFPDCRRGPFANSSSGKL